MLFIFFILSLQTVKPAYAPLSLHSRTLAPLPVRTPSVSPTKAAMISAGLKGYNLCLKKRAECGGWDQNRSIGSQSEPWSSPPVPALMQGEQSGTLEYCPSPPCPKCQCAMVGGALKRLKAGARGTGSNRGNVRSTFTHGLNVSAFIATLHIL